MYNKSIKAQKRMCCTLNNGTQGVVLIDHTALGYARQPQPSYHYTYSTSFRALTHRYSCYMLQTLLCIYTMFSLTESQYFTCVNVYWDLQKLIRTILSEPDHCTCMHMYTMIHVRVSIMQYLCAVETADNTSWSGLGGLVGYKTWYF